MENMTEGLRDDERTWEKLRDNWKLNGMSEQSTNYLGMKGTAMRIIRDLERDLADAESRMGSENIGNLLAMMEEDYKVLATNNGCLETMETMMRPLVEEVLFRVRVRKMNMHCLSS